MDSQRHSAAPCGALSKAVSSDCAWTASIFTQLHVPDPVVSFDASVETLAE